jgi:hypothetical protein
MPDKSYRRDPLHSVNRSDLDDPGFANAVVYYHGTDLRQVADLARAVLAGPADRKGAMFVARFRGGHWATDEELAPTPEETREAKKRETTAREAKKRADDPPLSPADSAQRARAVLGGQQTAREGPPGDVEGTTTTKAAIASGPPHGGDRGGWKARSEASPYPEMELPE